MPSDKLIRMANQIATFCASDPDVARRPAAVADHINRFWDPRMRLGLLSRLREGSAGEAHPLVVEAASLIRPPRDAEDDGHQMAKNSP